MVKTDNTAYQALVLVWLGCGKIYFFYTPSSYNEIWEQTKFQLLEWVKSNERKKEERKNTTETRGGPGGRDRTLAMKRRRKTPKNQLLPKYWGKQIFSLGSSPKRVKSKRQRGKKERREKDWKMVITMASYALQKRHLGWRTQSRLGQKSQWKQCPTLVPRKLPGPTMASYAYEGHHVWLWRPPGPICTTFVLSTLYFFLCTFVLCIYQNNNCFQDSSVCSPCQLSQVVKHQQRFQRWGNEVLLNPSF